MRFSLQFFIPVFDLHQSLFIYDCYQIHKTVLVTSTCQNNYIPIALIPAGITPLGIAMNRSFPGLIQEFVEEVRDWKEMDVLKNKVMINIVLLQQKQLVLHGKPDMKTLQSGKL